MVFIFADDTAMGGVISIVRPVGDVAITGVSSSASLPIMSQHFCVGVIVSKRSGGATGI